MLGHTGVILKINMNDYKIWINETCFSYENKLHVTNSMIGQTVQYSLNQTGMINHLELVVQKTKELKGKIQSMNFFAHRWTTFTFLRATSILRTGETSL